MDAHDGVFLDETGVHLAMARYDARSPQGERVHTSKPVNKGKNMTVLGALSVDGIMASMTVEGSNRRAGVFNICTDHPRAHIACGTGCMYG